MCVYIVYVNDICLCTLHVYYFFDQQLYKNGNQSQRENLKMDILTLLLRCIQKPLKRQNLQYLMILQVTVGNNCASYTAIDPSYILK